VWLAVRCVVPSAVLLRNQSPVGPCTVPGLADEQASVVAFKVGGPLGVAAQDEVAQIPLDCLCRGCDEGGGAEDSR
jgi:hypothetical protein